MSQEWAGGSDPVVERTVPPGANDRIGAVWSLKERIREREGVLVQRQPFFAALYRDARCHLALSIAGRAGDGMSTADLAGDVLATVDNARDGVSNGDHAGDVVGFALAREDGYLSLIGVAPGHRRRGLGSGLLDRVAEDHERVTCHVRATNTDALSFYTDRGFVVDRRVPGYYRDGADAYLLVRDGDGRGLADLL